jgi:hypothetical protein
LAGLGALVGVLVAAPADAASLGTPLRCWIIGERNDFSVDGSGFPPQPSSTLVSYAAEGGASTPFEAWAYPASDGTFRVQVPGDTSLATITPKRMTVEATVYGQPSPAAWFSVPLVLRGLNQTGIPPHSVAVARSLFWEFAGMPHATVYAHYLFSRGGPSGYRHVGTARFGRTRGDCGVLRMRRPTFRGVAFRAGFWQIQFDTQRRYRRRSVISWLTLMRCGMTTSSLRLTLGTCGIR